MANFYNGTKLLNSKDLNGNTPSIFVCDGNKSAGKTVYFSRYLVNRFKKYGEKFILLYRYKNELENVSDKFFNDIRDLFFVNDTMQDEKMENGNYINLYLNEKHCGYAMAVNSAYTLKKLSHVFTDSVRIMFDEFQVPKDQYCCNEVDKFITLYDSIARGGGKSTRYVQVIMISNHISALNPYYKAWDCCVEVDKITDGYYKKDGLVIEKVMNTSVVDEKKEIGFYQAFASSKTMAHVLENKSLFENNNFIEEIKLGTFNYICNICCDGHHFALKQVLNNDKVRYYFTDKIDPNVNTRFVISALEHNDTSMLVGHNFELIRQIRILFDCGYVRFSDIQTKECAFAFLQLTLK